VNGLGKRLRHVERLAGEAPPDPLPSWWRKPPERMPDDELEAAAAWHGLPDPRALTDDELAQAVDALPRR
jgi:hypothetical protein